MKALNLKPMVVMHIVVLKVDLENSLKLGTEFLDSCSIHCHDAVVAFDVPHENALTMFVITSTRIATPPNRADRSAHCLKSANFNANQIGRN